MSEHPTLSALIPIFPVSDVRAALDHYAALGFRVSPYEEGSGYGFAERDEVALHLTHRPTSYYPDDGIAVAYLMVDSASALCAEWSRPGIPGRTDPPGEMPWRMHEGRHVDPDGNVIRFGSPTS